MSPLIQLKDVVSLQEFTRFSKPLNWEIKNGEHWAVIGPNGAGKTLLADILVGKHLLKSGKIIKESVDKNFIKTVTFRDIYSFTDIQNSYYQQRWNKGLEEDTTPVEKLLQKETDPGWINHLVSIFNIADLMEKNIQLLSSGELRKFLIVKSLATHPRILVLDNPFIGLDVKSRELLKDVFQELSRVENLQLVLIIPDISDISPVVTHVISLKNKEVLSISGYNDFLRNKKLQDLLFFQKGQNKIQFPVFKKQPADFDFAVQCKSVNIKYGSKTILKNLSWKVRKGEKWALLGENGSGKSTLLSLVAADNPQAYANNIVLFDKKRGSGESIWDIKKRIGYISPEMHLFYFKNISCLQAVCSGFFDSIGFYRKCTESQEKTAEEWMKIFKIEALKNLSFLQISNGEQRLVLLARLFVKNPDLLILDEPFHGLDSGNKNKVKNIIEQYCNQEKTLIYVTHYLEEISEVVEKHLTLTKIFEPNKIME